MRNTCPDLPTSATPAATLTVTLTAVGQGPPAESFRKYPAKVATAALFELATKKTSCSVPEILNACEEQCLRQE
jgi:hypothetical protein